MIIHKYHVQHLRAEIYLLISMYLSMNDGCLVCPAYGSCACCIRPQKLSLRAHKMHYAPEQ